MTVEHNMKITFGCMECNHIMSPYHICIRMGDITDINRIFITFWVLSQSRFINIRISFEGICHARLLAIPPGNHQSLICKYIRMHTASIYSAFVIMVSCKTKDSSFIILHFIYDIFKENTPFLFCLIRHKRTYDDILILDTVIHHIHSAHFYTIYD